MNQIERKQKRIRRRRRTRANKTGTSQRPRLAVFRSNKYFSAQLVDDEKGNVLAFARAEKKQASSVGVAIVERAKARGISRIVFDRSGYKYHGRVKELAEKVREQGISL